MPFKILSATTNDNEYLINTNFQGKGVNKSAPGIKITPNIKDNFEPVKQKFGYNDLKKVMLMQEMLISTKSSIGMM